ncbi:MAG: DMT family transporter [Bacteroidaceae bacterium]
MPVAQGLVNGRGLVETQDVGVVMGLAHRFTVLHVDVGFAVFAFVLDGVAILLGVLLLAGRQRFRVTFRQACVLLVLGLLYTGSSLMLFESYRYMPSGLATTLVFLYPVLVALIMVFLHVVPSWPVWLAVGATFAGVAIMTQGGSMQSAHPLGFLLASGSALSYALFIVVAGRSKAVAPLSSSLLTFYTLLVGAVVFWGKAVTSGCPLTAGISTVSD